MAFQWGDLFDRLAQIKDDITKHWGDIEQKLKPPIAVPTYEGNTLGNVWGAGRRVLNEPSGERPEYKEPEPQPELKPIGAPNPPVTTTPLPTPTATPAPEAMPTPIPDKYSKDDVAEAIRKGFRKWANLEEQGLPDTRVPMIKYADKFAEEIEKNPFLKRFPFLLPVLTILETSGGQNVTFKNNPLNWGVVQQRMGYFNPGSMETTIEKAASGIAERTAAYEKFRETGDVADLAAAYAPPSENLTEDYIKNLRELMRLFEGQLESH